MTGPVFVDTNVLIYAFDKAAGAKQQVAQRWRAALWQSRRGRTSFQVLQEFYVNVIKLQPSARAQARDEVRDLLSWRPVRLDGNVIEAAWRIQDRYQLSFWDALIVAAAKAASCRYLLTEDLQPDQDLEGIQVMSPFASGPDSLPSD